MKEYMAVANIIAAQLGGAKVMIGAKNLIAGANEKGNPYLSFGLMKNPKKITHIRIVYTPNDLYTVQGFRYPSNPAKVKPEDYNPVVEEYDVYASDLRRVISNLTGLATSL